MKPLTAHLRILTGPALLALAPLAAAPLRVEPQHPVVTPGAAVRFQVRPVLAETKSDAAPESKDEARWRWEVPGHPGLIDADTGQFTAPTDPDLQTYPILARAQDGRRLGTTVSVPPAALEDKAAETKDQPAFPRRWSALGFSDPFDPALLTGLQGPVQRLTAVPGLPRTVPLPFPEAARQLLSYRLGPRHVHRDVTGLDRVELLLETDTPLVVQALRDGTKAPEVQVRQVALRGLQPLAGGDPAGFQDGDGAGARLGAIGAMVALPGGDFLVADTGNHCLRKVDALGRVRTFCGRPDLDGEGRPQPGFQDGPAHEARFHAPSGLALRLHPDTGAPEIWIADQGNRALRVMDLQGNVVTRAGAFPAGAAGLALAPDYASVAFHAPCALTVAGDGTVYLADGGEHQVLWALRPDGWAGVVAGRIGQPGPDTDGPALEALFRDLRALCPGPDGSVLILDGHCLRQYRPGQAAIRTLLGRGRSDQPGNLGALGHLPLDPAQRARPALRAPAALAWQHDLVTIADAGNHSLVNLEFNADGEPAAVSTILGDATRAVTQPGMLRGGLPGPLTDHHASVRQPSALLPMAGGLVVASGGALLTFDAPTPGGSHATLEPLEIVPGQGPAPEFQLRFPGLGPDGSPDRRVLHYAVQAFDPSGALVQSLHGQGPADGAVTVRPAFTRSGGGKLQVFALKEDGLARLRCHKVRIDLAGAAVHAPTRLQLWPRARLACAGDRLAYAVQASGAALGQPLDGKHLTWTAVDADTQKKVALERRGDDLVVPSGGPSGFRLLHLQAALPGVAGACGETHLLVTPPDLFGQPQLMGLVTAYLGMDAEFAHSPLAPLLGDGRRLVLAAAPRPAAPWHLPIRLAGCASPTALDWIGDPGATRQILRICSPRSRHCFDVTGRDRHPMTFQGFCGTAEWCLDSERLTADGQGVGRSRQCGRIRVVGLAPFLGSPYPGRCDEAKGEARFQEPAGMVQAGPEWGSALVLADPGAGAILAHHPGQPGEPGRLTTLFGPESKDPGRPAFLALCRVPGETGAREQIVVSDPARHTLELLEPGGRRVLLAGVPGQPGADPDADGRQQLRGPMGVACRGASIYLADSGNQVIREFDLSTGAQRVLAGQMGQAGSPGAPSEPAGETRFRALGAMALRPGILPRLTFIDGNAIRELDLDTRMVSTLLGVQDAEGAWADLWRNGPVRGGEAFRVPCLDRPADLAWDPAGLRLTIADRGNHAIRVLHMDSHEASCLFTLVGDPALGRTRSGLLRDGRKGPLPDPCAAIAAPRALCPLADGRTLVATGHQVVEVAISAPEDSSALVGIHLRDLRVAPAEDRGRGTATFRVVGAGASGIHAGVPVTATVTFLDEDGNRLSQVQATGRTGTPIQAAGRLPASGPGRVEVVVTSDQGVCAWDGCPVPAGPAVETKGASN